ncbi:hybrid sensor histidine kinase/response regulator transcription factor [Echinicola pacifica]|nr:two-component regulator propeller domain-containing protein [Echinicola pacifica]
MKPYRTYLFLLCLCFAYLPFYSMGQIHTRQLRFFLMDIESGLSHNYINSIEQDSLGFIWIGTLEGLNRYDGKSFIVYPKSNRFPSKGPAHNFIQQLLQSPNQQMLMATSAGLTAYDQLSGTFAHQAAPSPFPRKDVSFAAFSPSGSLAVAFYGEGVRLFEASDQSKAPFHASQKQPQGLSAKEITSLVFQGDSLLYIGSNDLGLTKINLQTMENSPSYHGINRGVQALDIDSEGNLWVGAQEGLDILLPSGKKINIQKAEVPERGLSDSNILCFEEDDEGNIWVGTRNGGLSIIDIGSIKTSEFPKISWFTPASDGSSVYNRTVSALKYAKDGNMWIGTSTGLNIVNTKGDPILLLQRNLSQSHTLSHDRIGSLAMAQDSSIWIGTDGGGLDLLHPRKGIIRNFSHTKDQPHSLSNNYIISLLEDSQHRLWVGTYQGGLNRLQTKTGQFKHYLQGSQADGNDVRVIHEDQTGQIWVGTNRGGLYRYHPPIDNFDYVKQLGKVDIRGITEDEYGNLFLATYGEGIIQYNYLTGNTVYFNESTVEGFPTNVLFSIDILDNGDILAGTRFEGLLQLHPETRQLSVFTVEEGLSNNTINSITKDNEGNVWLGTFKGISSFNPKTKQIKTLNGFNNVQQSEFNIGAAITGPDGRIYLGGNKGLNIFSPQELVNKESPYPLVFTHLNLPGAPESDSLKMEYLDQRSIAFSEALSLPYNQRLFSLEFVALKFPKGDNIQYSYLLEPYHDQWIPTQQSGMANFSNVPPGRYTLKVRAFSTSSNISERQLTLIITPPFWKTWPAYLLYILLIVGLIYIGLKYYTDRLKLKNSLLFEQKQRQLEHEINEERARFFTGFSHELKTPLTLIIAPVEDLLAKVRSPEEKKSLSLIETNAKYLLDMITKLLEFRKSELHIDQLNLQSYNITKALSQWLEEYASLAKHQKIQLTGSFPKEDIYAMVDLEKLHIIINNLLSNALKYCRPQDEVQVILQTTDGEISIEVKDNGPGIPESDQDKIFNWYYQAGQGAKNKGTGIGLALTKRLVEDHQGSIRLSSKANEGCSFVILLPDHLPSPQPPSSEEPGQYKEISSPWSAPITLPTTRMPIANLDLNTSRRTLLIIDDNPQILNYLQSLLEGDYDLIFAENGQIGLDKAIQFVPDLILSDIMMPEKNGIDLCGELKTKTATTHIPVILLSAKDSVDSITSGYAQGADDYLTKPFNGQILLSRINNLLQTQARLREYYLGKEPIQQGFSEQQTSAINQEKEFLKTLHTHIVSQLALQNTDVESLCALMGMSRTSLFRKLKAITGQNINQYTRKVKLDYADHLIREKGYLVSEAAFEVGFSSSKYFRKHFKEQFGRLPSDPMN